jgi:hypothetical protein
MIIKASDLRAIADRLFAYLEETGRREVEISEDYYWAISKEEIYDPSKDPTDLTIGQLSDDWKELSAIVKGDSPPIGYALVWFSAILRAIGEKTVY